MTVNSLISGQGPVLVLLHGYCESSWVWHKLVPELSENFTLVSIDLPGVTTPLASPDFSLAEIASAVHLHLIKKGFKSYSVIGHSMGGYIALEMALQYPETVGKITLFHSSIHADSQEKLHVRKKAITFIEKHGIGAFLESFVPGLLYEKKKETINQVVQMGAAIPQSIIIAYTKAMMQRKSFVAILPFLTLPIQFIIGKQDAILPFSSSLKMLESAELADVKILRNCGHMGMLENHKESLESITRFHNFIF